MGVEVDIGAGERVGSGVIAGVAIGVAIDPGSSIVFRSGIDSIVDFLTTSITNIARVATMKKGAEPFWLKNFIGS